MAVIDAFTYNGEIDMLNLHLGMLSPHVDQFVIVESRDTFSGKMKPLYFNQHRFHFREFEPKIHYYIVENEDLELRKLAKDSPNTQGAAHWKEEFYQKESIKKALQHLNDEDTVYIGDVDEIWDPGYKLTFALEKLYLRVYAYNMDNESNEEFWGTIATKWGLIKNKTLNHVRIDTIFRGNIYAGWHFTSMGGLKEVQRKLNDSYTTESYNTREVQDMLPQRMRANMDFLGRNFEYKQSENNWPQYLKDNREDFAHLCKGIKTVHSGRGRYND